MSATRKCFAAAALVSLAFTAQACGGKHGQTDGWDAGTSAYALTLVGAPNYQLHPGDKRTLQVLLSQDQVGPVANAGIHFEFQDGDAAGALLDVKDTTTDSSGVAQVHFTAGNTANGHPTFKVVASTTTLDAEPVAFSFTVIPIRRLLQILGSPATTVAPDGSSATVSMGISTSIGLKIRELDQDNNGSAISGDTITFTLPPAAKAAWSGAGTRATTALTGAGGEAQVFLLSTQQAEGPFLVSAQSAAGGAAVTFNVTVQATGTGAGCTSSQQCNPGQTCVNGHCQDGGGGSGCDSSSDNPCPFGYICTNGVCQPPSGGNCDPAAPNCPSSQCCNPSDNTCHDICPGGCGPGTHCQPGASCGAGTCVNDAPGTPDVTGVWLTKHSYSIREALPQTVQDIFKAIRLLDQALLGKLTIPGIPGWLQDIINSIVSKLLQQYLPPWLQQMIHISDDIVTILSDLRGEGSMRLAKGADIAHVKGTEVWTSLVFYWLPLCGNNIGGDPGAPPDCARIDIATTDSENPGEVGQCKGQSLPSITVQVAPFTASIDLKTGSTTAYVLNVAERQVKIKMGKVILVLVDYLITWISAGQYHCIDEATDCAAGNPCMVDCPGIAAAIDNATGGLVGEPTIEALCDGVVTAAGQAVTVALANAWPVNADLLDFSGKASITKIPVDASNCDPGSPGNCAGLLGNDNFDKDLHANPGAQRDGRDGNWSGDFFFKLLGKLPGAWEAKRPE